MGLSPRVRDLLAGPQLDREASSCTLLLVCRCYWLTETPMRALVAGSTVMASVPPRPFTTSTSVDSLPPMPVVVLRDLAEAGPVEAGVGGAVVAEVDLERR